MTKLGYSLAVGLNKGHKVTKRELPQRHGRTKGANYKSNKFRRNIVREVCGLAPYEKRAIELLRIAKDKRCLKFLKKRLGTNRRAKRKRTEMDDYIKELRKATAHKQPPTEKK